MLLYAGLKRQYITHYGELTMINRKSGIITAMIASIALMAASPVTIAGDDAKARKAECKKEAKAKNIKDKAERKAYVKECMKGKKGE